MTDIKKRLGTLFKVVGIILTLVGGYVVFVIWVAIQWTGPYAFQINLVILFSVILAIGINILVVGIILRHLARQIFLKKLDSMSQSDLAKMFDCPSSGNKGAVHLIKLVKDQILVKQSCPTLHPYGWNSKVRHLGIPLRLKDQCVPYFRDAVFRCFKCGQEATVDHVKFSGPWTLIKLSCPTHGNKLPTHKIWSTIYSDISNGVDATP